MKQRRKPRGQRRLYSPEDRYMALYGQDEWAACNMEMSIHFDPAHGDTVRKTFRERLERKLAEGTEESRLLREEAVWENRSLTFEEPDDFTVERLFRPRRGVYFDTADPGRIRCVWNHAQTDGVGLWRVLRDLFDDNPPLVPYKDVPAPVRFFPELLALPSAARRLTWRGRLKRLRAVNGELHRGLEVWPTEGIRALRAETARLPFNLFASGLVLAQVFARHPDRDRLTVGLTAYYPFLLSRNKYAVFLCNVRRGPLPEIVQQLHAQTRSRILAWGQSALQSFVLNTIPEWAFARVVNYFRRQVDVLISSLPVGRQPITLGGVPTLVSCHPWELSIPYYALMVGTRAELHVSFTSKFEEEPGFMSFGSVMNAMG